MATRPAMASPECRNSSAEANSRMSRSRIARRVLGNAHPTVLVIERCLQLSRAALHSSEATLGIG